MVAKRNRLSNQLGIEVFLHELKSKTFDKHNCVTVALAFILATIFAVPKEVTIDD